MMKARGLATSSPAPGWFPTHVPICFLCGIPGAFFQRERQNHDAVATPPAFSSNCRGLFKLRSPSSPSKRWRERLPSPTAEQGADAPRLSDRPPPDADVETGFLNRSLVFFPARLCRLGRMTRPPEPLLNEPGAHAPEASPQRADLPGF